MDDLHTLKTHYYCFGNQEGDGYEVYFDEYPQIKGFGDSYDEAYEEALQALKHYLKEQQMSGITIMQEALGAYDAQRYGEAKAIWERLCEHNADAAVNLATLYVKGQGVARNMAKAAELFDGAVKKGHELAAFYLGGMFENGIGVAKDPTRAHGYYEFSAAKGNVTAMVKLGLMLQQSDVKTAMYWLIEAAHKGDAQAQQFITYVSNAALATNLNTAFRTMDEAAQRHQVESVVRAHIAPALAKDEGGIELVHYMAGETPQIWLRYLGACSGCHLGSTSTADMIIGILETHIDAKIVLYLW
ncbi:MAG: SEL1-like repeat protein [Campylobacterales bacterium]|nr:SEL1-like repeat protein [Campylobacterales bacterium]